jgi:hypothetical protein
LIPSYTSAETNAKTIVIASQFHTQSLGAMFNAFTNHFTGRSNGAAESISASPHLVVFKFPKSRPHSSRD